MALITGASPVLLLTLGSVAEWAVVGSHLLCHARGLFSDAAEAAGVSLLRLIFTGSAHVRAARVLPEGRLLGRSSVTLRLVQ